MHVYLSQTAYEQLHEIIDYLETSWSYKVRDNFLEKLNRSMDLISQMPYAAPASQNFPGIRKCVITPQVSAFYRVDEVRKEIEILAVLDNRQNFKY